MERWPQVCRGGPRPADSPGSPLTLSQPHAATVLRRVGADLDSQAAANESKAAVRVQAHARGSAARNQLQEKRRLEWLSYGGRQL